MLVRPVQEYKKELPTSLMLTRGLRSTSFRPLHLARKPLGMVSMAERGAKSMLVRPPQASKK